MINLSFLPFALSVFTFFSVNTFIIKNFKLPSLFLTFPNNPVLKLLVKAEHGSLVRVR